MMPQLIYIYIYCYTNMLINVLWYVYRLARLLHLMRLNNLSVGSPAIIYANVGATKLQLHFGEAYRVGKLVTVIVYCINICAYN